jgi:hypothetical protein
MNKNYMKRSSNHIGKIGCLFQILYLIGYISLSTYAAISILSWFDKVVPTWANILIGLFSGPLSITIWIIGSILRVCGVF